MGTIEYKPHCAKCGALINREITYQDIIVEGKTISDFSHVAGIDIDPCKCENCGEIFDHIEIKMPKKYGEVRI